MTEYIIFCNSNKNAKVEVDILEGCLEHDEYSTLYGWFIYDRYTTRRKAKNKLALLRQATHVIGKFVLLRITKEIELLDS
jgi:hypothetical protein